MQTYENPETTMLYRCPSCKTAVEVDEHYIGETVDCPSCDRPFQVTTPQAFPIQDGEEVGETRSLSVDDVADTESVEKVIHPVVFRRHLFTTTISIVALVCGSIGVGLWLSGEVIWGIGGTMLLAVSGVLLLFAAAFLLKFFLQSRFHSLSLSNERLIYRKGIIQRATSEVRHDDVRNVKVDQNFVERLLGFGDIAISSAGQDDMEIVINDIPNPSDVVDFIRKRQ